MVSVGAAVAEGAIGLGPGIASILLVPAGFAYSYHQRDKKNVLLKIILTVALFVIFASFIGTVRFATTVDETRSPLVALFLWVQVLHSFDVPRPRDLSFSIAAGVVLVALAGSLAFSTSFVFFVLAFAALLIAALALSHHDELNQEAASPMVAVGAKPVISGHVPALARRLATTAIATLVCTSVVFVFLPRLPVRQIASLPFTLTRNTPIPGFVGNVAVPGGGGSQNGSSEAFDPDSYFGYGDNLDLRVRGTLSDALVMRVRAAEPSLYRGEVYDTYADGRWTSSDADLVDRRGDGYGSISIPRPEDETSPVPYEEVVQTFYVERDMPNIVFHAYRADAIYISSTRLRVDDFSSIRAPEIIEKDTIYSVVSHAPRVDRATLRTSAQTLPPGVDYSRYLQLPPALEGRFRKLANTITEPFDTTVDKAQAVEDWLHENKRYRLDISRDPGGRDPVDVFTFERDEGFCEQIAATMALMLRASGVPARVVTGFGAGERNLFTGYWEIHNSDAHAWVEVYYPSFGWIPYDPTFGVPLSSAANTTFMLAPLRNLARSLYPGEALRHVGTAMSAFMSGAPLAAGAAGVVLFSGLGALIVRFAARAKRRRRSRDHLARTWLDFERALRRKGIKRAPDETALEFATRASGRLPISELRDAAESFSRARYGPSSDDYTSAFTSDAQLAKRMLRRYRPRASASARVR
jgi:transglutaminase-like putative cysteine protease